MFPKTFYSGKFGTLTVATEAQETAARVAGFEERQSHQEFPRAVYHASKGQKIVQNADEKSALGEEWEHQPITDFKTADPVEIDPAKTEVVN